MNKLELAEALRKGAETVEELFTIFLETNQKGETCGCALGTAWIGKGLREEAFNWSENGLPGEGIIEYFARHLNVDIDLLERVHTLHLNETPRAQIADLLEREHYADEEEAHNQLVAELRKKLETLLVKE